MPCTRINSAIVCTHATVRLYICFEARAYLMELSPLIGPAFFTVPGDQWIDAEPGGILWNVFEEWMEGR